jgi:hypothetical protein
MPPASYLLIALILVIAIVAWLAATHMYGIFLLYVLFGAGASLLGAVAIFRVTYVLQTPFWLGLALAGPALVWGLHRLFELVIPGSPFVMMSFGFRMAAALALTAACVRLIEIMSVSSAMTHIAYGILALSAALTLLGLFQFATGTYWTRNAGFAELLKWARWPIAIVKYGALAAAPVMVVIQRHIERWVLVPIVGVAVAEGCAAVFAPFGRWPGPLALYGGVWFWLQPVALFVAAAAVWRMGSVLLARRREEGALSGVAA